MTHIPPGPRPESPQVESAVARLFFHALALVCLLLVISGAIAHLTALVVVGGGLYLVDAGIVLPFRRAHLAKRRQG